VGRIAQMRLRRKRKEFVRGYDWCMGALMRGEMTALKAEMQIATGSEFDPKRPFDDGARAALARYMELTPEAVMKPRAEFLDSAKQCGARITGKPDGSEPIEVVFSIEAWRKFDAEQGRCNSPLPAVKAQR